MQLKKWQIIGASAGATVVGMGVAMLVTNPGRQAYEDYAARRLETYLKENVCTQLPEDLSDFLRGQGERMCNSLVDVSNPQFRQLVARTTERQNYGLFSIYRTRLSIGPLFPSYEFETVGAFQTFVTYRSEEQ